MNGRTAKRLRKQVYGDFSLKDVNYTRGPDNSVRCVGRRTVYQELKKENRTQSEGSRIPPKGKKRPRWLFSEKRDQ